MANTRYLTTVVEQHVRTALAEQYAVPFTKRTLPLVKGPFALDGERGVS